MGILHSPDGSLLIYLKPVHVFGRDPNVSDYLLAADQCSRMHCVIQWQNGRWLLRDESRNGSYINGEKVQKGQNIALHKGDTVTFSNHDDLSWTFTDTAMPQPALVALDGTGFFELQTLNILPNENAPECQVLKQGQKWIFEKEDDFRPISEGSEVQISNKSWKFHTNFLLDETEFKSQNNTQKTTLTFNVSRSEEHIQLIVETPNIRVDLGSKTHHYLLLEMARHSLEDIAANDNDRGWIDNELLLQNLKIDINHLNIQIYRARKAMRKHSEFWSQNMIGRRRGEIRLYPCNIIINKESN